MTQMGQSTRDQELEQACREKSFLQDYINELFEEYGEYPLYVDEVTEEHDVGNPNVMYQVGENAFIHIHGPVGEAAKYYVVEPELTDEERETADKIKKRMLELSATVTPPDTDDEFNEYFDELFQEALVDSGESQDLLTRAKNILEDKMTLEENQNSRIKYVLTRNISGLGPLQGVMLDSQNEDIHVIGHDECYIDHGTFGLISTDVSWNSQEDLESWMENIGERIENPVSDATPIVDATLPDGSRINIIYSSDVSIRGPSMTIRQGVEVPLSILQITKWGTLSPRLSAYLWLCLENEQTVFVVGETASGKTTTLNSIMTFIPRDSKVYTAEETAEVQPPHDTWQQLLTRDGGGGGETTEVDMFDLVAAALRSRPTYVIVGEVRGAEAQMAFQAAQTGHPVMLTFHASDVVSMIQRLSGEPINVPETFIDNCDVALFQNRVKRDDDLLRRVTSVQEIEGYSKEEEGVITRQVFSWNPSSDEIEFKGMNNSFVLEEQIATLLGYEDSKEIYDELARREEIIERMIDADIMHWDEVNDAIETIQRDGVEALDEINSTGLVD